MLNVHVDHMLIICWSCCLCRSLTTKHRVTTTGHRFLCFVSVCDPDRYHGPIMDSVSMCLRYMAEINDDMDRTRATTAAKAAYEVAERKMRKGESMVKALHHQIQLEIT